MVDQPNKGLRPDVYGEDTPFPSAPQQVGPTASQVLPQALTPTQQVVEDVNRVAFGVDARGRRIGVRRLSMATRRKAIKSLSAESADKGQYVGLASVACSVVSIDDRPISFPTSEMMIDALIDELDDDGFTAVNTILREQFPARGTAQVKNS